MALTFKNKKDYDEIKTTDKISVIDLNSLTPGEPVTALIEDADGSKKEIICHHTFSQEQLYWFKEGSALNYLITKTIIPPENDDL